jgi:hypothetical protein
MATKMYVSQFSKQAVDRESKPIAAPDWSSKIGATLVIDYNAGAARIGPFDPNTRFIRMHTDSICSFKFGGSSVVATTGDDRMIAGQTEFAGIEPGSYLSAITNT